MLPLKTVEAYPAPAPAGDLALVTDHLTKRFGNRTAVDGLSLSVAKGEVFGFLGPNGAGKTTTVRMLGTLIAPSSGSAVVAGLALSPANGVEIRQRISIMPESPGLYLRLSVDENLQCFAGLYGLADPRPDAYNAPSRRSTWRAGPRTPAAPFPRASASGSGWLGCLLNDPEVVFLDEPTSGLDPVATREVHELIDGLRKQGVTIFLTTHRLEEAERLCDRVAIFSTTLRSVGRPDELRDRLFKKELSVETVAPLASPEAVFGSVPSVEGWSAEGSSRYLLSVADTRAAAPEVARALVRAGADILSIAVSRHSLEDVYMELVDEDVEVIQEMNMSMGRVRAIARKEFRDYRRNRFVVFTMAISPVVFVVWALISILLIPAAKPSAALNTQVGLSMLFMLLVPAFVPAVISAYAVVGEREQGTLEPVLTTPVRSEEFLLGKALAALAPTLVISYAIFGVVLACVALFAHPAVSSAVFRAPLLLALALFTPLIAGWSILVGIATSARSRDVRVAQQIATFASLPPVAVTALMSFRVIPQSLAVALGLAAGLVLVDSLGWRAVSAMFDRERLVTRS